jgi:hypothetical protein
MKIRMYRYPLLVFVILLGCALACDLPGVTPTPEVDTDDVVATSVAATQTAYALETLAAVTADTETPTVEPPTATHTDSPASPTSTATSTESPPAGGVSLNCDGTYQRVRITDGGASGKTVSVDNWDGSAWINVWNYAAGDPMIKQIQDEAGYYEFLGCQKLVIIPEVYSGSGAILELRIYVWNGSGLTNVYTHDGTHGTWNKVGDTIVFEESLYLYGEPNCCPCNRQVLEYTWDGVAFVQTGSAINPTYSGTPPPECSP